MGPHLRPPVSQEMVMLKFAIKTPFGIVLFSSGIFR